MKQIALLFSAVFLIVASSSAQIDTANMAKTKKKKDWSKISLNNRANDHFMVQLGYDGWDSKPDSIHTTGFSHSFNMYLMLDFPFKSDPRFSIGMGLGIGSSNIKFDKQEVNIISQTVQLPFPNKADTTHFKKYKLVSTYAEVPVELRFITNPENSDASWKIALGIKFGALLDIHTRGKTLVSSGGATLNSYTQKQKDKAFFNGTRMAGTLRMGYGYFSVFGQYQFTSYIRDGRGPNVHPFSIGITLSGL